MKRVNEKHYSDYTIVAPGWTLTLSNFKNVLTEWTRLDRAGCTLYGNKPDGTRAILDTK